MIEPARFLRALRRACLALAVLLAGYLVLRFDVVELPEGARSPLYGIHPGDRLLVDRYRRLPATGEAVLYRGERGELLLGRATAPPQDLPAPAAQAIGAGALWILSECADVPAPDSRELGPIPPERVVGRVVLVLPW